MSGYDDARTAIEARMQGGFSALPIWFENADFDTKQNSAGYVAFFIRESQGSQASINTSPLLRFAGLITAQVFVPKGSNRKVADGHAATIATLFTRARFSRGVSGAITTTVPAVVPLGERDDWFQTNVEVSYRRDVI